MAFLAFLSTIWDANGILNSSAQYGQWSRDQAFVVDFGQSHLVIFGLYSKSFGCKTLKYAQIDQNRPKTDQTGLKGPK